MELLKTTIRIGLDKPFKVLHLSDTHLTFADSRDDQRKLDLAAGRLKVFGQTEGYLNEAAAYARENNMPIIHTGDLLDFVSELNIDKARAFCEENDVFMAAGNHEFSLYVGEAFEDAAYRNQSLAKVQAAFKNDIRFAVREIGGVNFVAIDNGYYLTEPEQLTALKAVVAEGKPVVVMMHTPLHTKALYDSRMTGSANNAALMGTPEELLQCYSPDRYRQQKPDAPTLEMVDYLKNEPLIKALIVGHLHNSFEDAVTDTLTQYCTGLNTAREITFE